MSKSTQLIHRSSQDRIQEWTADISTQKALRALKESSASGRLDMQEALFRTMLDKWPRLRKDLDEIGGAVARLPWSVSPWQDKDKKSTPEAIEHAELVDSALWRCRPEQGKWEQTFSELICALTYGMPRGQTVHEVVWAASDIVYPSVYLPVTANYYAWSQFHGEPDELQLFRNGIDFQYKGTPFPRDKFLVNIHKSGMDHPIFGANLRCLVGWFGAAMFGLPWLMQYCQVFGIPFRTAKAKGTQAKKDAEAMLKSIGAGGWGVATQNFEFEIHDVMKGGNSIPQTALIEMADTQCTNLILGQSLTSSKGEGGAYALGKVHEGIRQEVLAKAASFVADVINSQLIPSILRLNYGFVPDKLPTIEYTIPGSNIDKGKLEYIQGLVDLGLELPEQWIRDQLCVPDVDKSKDSIFKPSSYRSNATDSAFDEIAAAAAERKKERRQW